jgi:hypothetical protein
MLGFALSCSNSSTSPTAQVLVGTVADSDARVGIVTTTRQARLFFCGGATSYMTATHWFTVDLDSSHQVVQDSGTSGPFSVVGRVDSGGATGTVVLGDNQMHVFQAAPVAPGTLAGVYEANAQCGKVGLIVTQPSSDQAPDGQGACVAPPTGGPDLAKVGQVNPLLPIARAADGSIRVEVTETNEEVSVLAAAPPAF